MVTSPYEWKIIEWDDTPQTNKQTDNKLDLHVRAVKSPLMPVFSVIYIDNQIDTSIKLSIRFSEQKNSNYCTSLETRYLIGQNQDAVRKYRVHTMFTWTRSEMGFLSDTLCDSVSRGLT